MASAMSPLAQEVAFVLKPFSSPVGVALSPECVNFVGAAPKKFHPCFFVHFKTNSGFKLKTLLKKGFYGSAI